MKKILFILFTLFGLSNLSNLNAQIAQVSQISSVKFFQFEPKFLYVDSNYNLITKTTVSKNGDTLFIPENVFGFLIKEIWDNDSLNDNLKPRPVIIFISKFK